MNVKIKGVGEMNAKKKNRGGRPKALIPLEESVVYQMYKNNVPPAEIAFKHGISVSTVQRIVKRFKMLEKGGITNE